MNNKANPTLYFFSAHSMNAIPMLSGLMSELLHDFKIVAVHIKVKEYAQLPSGVTERLFTTLKDRKALLSRTRFQNFLRYIYQYLEVLNVILFKREKIFYCTDDVTTRIVLFCYKFFRKGKRTHIVYHEFENIDEINNHLLHHKFPYGKLPLHLLDLVIAPEENRLQILLSHLGLPESHGMMIPNTCKVNNKSVKPHEIFKKISPEKTTLLHVGSVGTRGHYFENVISALPDAWTLILVGMLSEVQRSVLEKYRGRKDILHIDQLPHSELAKLYAGTDLGLILYKGMDQNYEFCAPNKLYEMWSSGVPVIGHRLKGLEGVFKHSFQGALFDFESPKLETDLSNWKQQFDQKDASSRLKNYFKEHLQIDRFAQQLSATLKQLQHEENLVSRRHPA